MKLIISAESKPFREALVDLLRQLGHDVCAYKTSAEALTVLQEQDKEGPSERISAFFMDVDLGENYVRFISETNALVVAPMIILITAHPEQLSRDRVSRYGAYACVDKRSISDSKILPRLTSRIEQAYQVIKKICVEFPLYGTSKVIQDVREQVRRKARSDDSIFIYGEKGSGKECVVRQLWAYSDRYDKPLVLLDCGVLKDGTHARSELFGHRKGAYTGANEARDGVFKQANTGTLLLDEIAEIPLDVQSLLFRALGDPSDNKREIKPLGESQAETVDVRIIAATNRNLKSLVKDGKLNEAIFDRLHFYRIDMPPLRQRKEDIPLLTKHYFSEFSSDAKAGRRTIIQSAIEALMQYDWPDNVRGVVRLCRELAGQPEDIITLDLLPSEIAGQADNPYPEIVCAFKALGQHGWNLKRACQACTGERKADTRDTLRYRLEEGYLIYLMKMGWKEDEVVQKIMSDFGVPSNLEKKVRSSLRRFISRVSKTLNKRLKQCVDLPCDSELLQYVANRLSIRKHVVEWLLNEQGIASNLKDSLVAFTGSK